MTLGFARPETHGAPKSAPAEMEASEGLIDRDVAIETALELDRERSALEETFNAAKAP